MKKPDRQTNTFRVQLLRAERDIMERALKACRGDVEAIRRLLRIDRSSVYRKLKIHGLTEKVNPRKRGRPAKSRSLR
jgi:transcriptional regulator of acetoin/glycerol metabolism